MKKIFLIIIAIALAFLGFKSFMDFENDLNNNENEKTEEKTEDVKKSIFNNYFVYQGFINYDSTEMSAFSESYNSSVDQWDSSIIDNGIDLKIMGESVVSELSNDSVESVSLLIYFEDLVDTKELNFLINGVDNITLFGEEELEKFEINLGCKEYELDINSYLEKLSMIRIVINDYAKLLNNGAYIKTL